MEKLKNYFIEIFINEGYLEGLTILQNVKNRFNIINELAETPEEAKELNDNYEKIFAQVQKIFENDYKIQQKQLQERQEKAEKINKDLQNGFNTFYKIVGVFFGFIWASFIIVFKIIDDLAKLITPKKKRKKKLF